MRRGQPRARRPKVSEIVLEDVQRLLRLAQEAALRGDYGYSSRLGELILLMAQGNRVRLPRWVKLSLCKNCHVALVPGVTLSVRTRRQGRTIYLVRRCLVCGYIHRLPLGEKPKASAGAAVDHNNGPADAAGLGAGQEGGH